MFSLIKKLLKIEWKMSIIHFILQKKKRSLVLLLLKLRKYKYSMQIAFTLGFVPGSFLFSSLFSFLYSFFHSFLGSPGIWEWIICEVETLVLLGEDIWIQGEVWVFYLFLGYIWRLIEEDFIFLGFLFG